MVEEQIYLKKTKLEETRNQKFKPNKHRTRQHVVKGRKA